jgi:hypothetical protein
MDTDEKKLRVQGNLAFGASTFKAPGLSAQNTRR